jgi:hypothetical protein
METGNSSNSSKFSLFKWIGLILVIVLLVAAAFVGGQLLNREAGPQALAGPGAGFTTAGGGPAGDTMQALAINIIPAEELPQTQPDAMGIFVSREDNSLFIGTGQMGMIVSSDGAEASHDGPVVEVVVNGDTLIYKEVPPPMDGPPTSGEIQQVVEAGTIDEIGDTSAITVWGRKVGDRIIAEILLYSEPMIFMAPGP